MIDQKQLLAIMPLARGYVSIYLDHLNAAMEEFDISTPSREAAFLAQIAHESGQLRYVREISSGETYEGRADLGNTSPGDGKRFRGRGLIQITGKTNYAACSIDLFGDEGVLVEQPELLEQPENACRSAAWFWASHGLNELADSGDFRRITKRINGGLNGIQERESYHARAMAALGVSV